MILRNLVICLMFLFTSLLSSKAQQVSSVPDLPLQLSAGKGSSEVLVIYLTGDGGWNSFNQQMVYKFEKQGYGVVALNARKYFWNEKSPEEFAHDFEQLSSYYLAEWEKTSLIIVGYSFGADVGSFLPARLSAELRKKIKKIVLLSPSFSTDFAIRLSDLIGESDNVSRRYKVEPEIGKTDLPIVCIFGNEEEKVLKGSLKNSKSLIIFELPGDHQYNHDLDLLLKTVGM